MSVTQQQIKKGDSITIVKFGGNKYFGFTSGPTPKHFVKDGTTESYSEEDAIVKTALATEDSTINIDESNVDLWDDNGNSYALMVPLTGEAVSEETLPVRIPA